ncbi:hypothetical protein Q7P35_005528 [Cladosporium inversicolor]
MLRTWQQLYGRDERQCQGWQHSNSNQLPYQDEEHDRGHKYQHYGQQQHHERNHEQTHEQTYEQHQEQRSPHQVSDILQTQHSVGEPQHRSSTLASSPPAAPELIRNSKRLSEQSYNLRSSNQAQYDNDLPVPNSCVGNPGSVPAVLDTERSSARNDSRSAGSDPCQQSDHNPGQPTPRVKIACEECRRKRRKCDEETPCWPCQDRKLHCDGRVAATAMTEEATKNHATKLQKLIKPLQEFLDSISSEVQDENRQNDGHDPRSSALWRKAERSLMLSPSQSEFAHRTGSHHLTHSWPSLQVLLQAAHVEIDSSYVMEAEERPSLCLYPDDEEVARWHDTQAGEFTDFMFCHDSIPGSTLPARIEHCGYNFSGRPFEGRGLRPQTYGVERRSSADKAPPDFATIKALQESYMKHIHVMQPFLDAVKVRGLLDDFIAWHGIRAQPSVTADQHDTTSGRPIKRRRHDNRSGVPPSRQPEPARLLCHALVYLIFALGEICMCCGPLRADSPPAERSGTRSSSLSHVQEAESSPLVIDNANALSLASSQTPSVDGTQRGNDDLATRKTPGLVYYAKAIEIFGGQIDGNSLVHAQLFLLAGLYKGQLARVKESMSWYAMAGRVLRQLLREQKLCDQTYWTWISEDSQALREKSERLVTNKYQNSIVLASWACMDLESEISAELDLLPSGIASIENCLLMPLAFPDVSAGCEDTSQPTETLLRFTSQLYLRKQLNQAHRQLYGIGCEELSLTEVRCTLRNLEATICTWQKDLPASMSWGLDDLPPTNSIGACAI